MSDSSAANENRPEEFQMTIQGGMLEALGINMYTSIGKCLVEFVANSYDSESRAARITIPFEAIDKARREVRAQAKQQKAEGERDPFTILLEPLPEDIVITITDEGHGMDPASIQRKFLPLNRNRRLDQKSQPTQTKSESGRRFVMGRKGLGKLAGFGAAEVVEVWSKRVGETFATSFKMDFNDIKNASDLSDVRFRPVYEDGLDAAIHGTKIQLRRLRCDALKAKSDTIEATLAENFFGIDKEDFAIELNGDLVKEQEVEYEFFYPSETFTTAAVDLGDLGTIELQYLVKFRARPGDENPASPFTKKVGSLPAGKRGARIYCNKRLAVGPSLLDLHSGVHNFQAQDYMECIVHADELDRHAIDFVNTNRSDIRRDNEVVDKVISVVSELMKVALAEQYKARDAKITVAIEQDSLTKPILRMLDMLPRKSKTSAKRILKVLAQQEGVHSERFKEMAPLLVQSVNASDVLVKLIDMGNDPKDLTEIAKSLHELAIVEQRDVLKVYRGRREGFAALQKLKERGEENWQKGPHFETELHDLLKQNPWLIRPEYSRYLTSDKQMGHVAKALSRELQIDEFAATKPVADENKRPDLVFALTESSDPHTIVITELKSPDLPLTFEHLTQLKGYMMQVSDFISTEYPMDCTVRGILIGAKPDSKTRARDQRLLLSELKDRPDPLIEVLGLNEMLTRAQKTHIDIIDALERDDKDEADNEGK